MFKHRLLTILVLVPFVLLALYYANAWFFGAIILCLILGSGLEWLQLIPLNKPCYKLLFTAVLLAGCFAIQWTYLYWLFVGLAVWVIILFCVQQFPRFQKIWGKPTVVGFFCLLLLPLFGQGMMAIFLMEKGKHLIVYLLCLVWAADIGAYVAGKLWGRHKLIPAVSPGKTYEGFFGGFVLSMVVALVGAFCLQVFSLWWFIVALTVMIISVVGDLFISMLKRRSGIKDTGNILPGHGGILDRLDSLIAAAPFFYCGLRLFMPGL